MKDDHQTSKDISVIAARQLLAKRIAVGAVRMDMS